MAQPRSSEVRDAEPDEDERACAIFEVIEAIVSHRTLPELIDEVAARLSKTVGCESVILMLLDAEEKALRVHLLGGRPTGLTGTEREHDLEGSVLAEVLSDGKPLLVPSTRAAAHECRTLDLLAANGLASVWYFPLRTPRRKLGLLGFCGTREGTPSESDQDLLQRVTNQVALAVENALNHESFTSERDRLKLLLDVNAAVVSHLDLKSLLEAIAGCLKRLLRYEYTSLSLREPGSDKLRIHAFDHRGQKPPSLAHEGLLISKGETPGAKAFETKQPVVARNLDELRAYKSSFMDQIVADGIRSSAAVPLLVKGKVLGTLAAASVRENAFTPGAIELLVQVASQIAPAVENALAYREIEALRDKLAREKVYLEGELQHDFQDIVGESPVLKKILKDVETVAPTDSTVMVWGETGTGKELIARAIHNLSGRKKGTFVKVNCAAIPTGLLESELFGHEKGAFTGALNQRIGRFEVADGGTLFLDEVGDIPGELQPKLLRVLQEQEFERLGGNKTIKVSVRLVAATNRDLAQMVADRTFRSDLYYRLNVFPVSLPSLRERDGDIELLVRHFVAKCARRMNKKIDAIPAETIATLQAYPWPGNVRELENFIERAVIVTSGSTLAAPLGELKKARQAPQPARVPSAAPSESAAEPTSLVDVEREHITKVLRETKWVVGGPKGAAARLGMSRTTLQSKMQKLGISRPD
jgi:formate hydrogenlyase transcriptional activator